jgi:hypothetical protein
MWLKNLENLQNISYNNKKCVSQFGPLWKERTDGHKSAHLDTSRSINITLGQWIVTIDLVQPKSSIQNINIHRGLASTAKL